jgi:hypothetical protein
MRQKIIVFRFHGLLSSLAEVIERNSRMWTKIVHLILPPSQVGIGGIEFELRSNGYGKRIYHSIH